MNLSHALEIFELKSISGQSVTSLKSLYKELAKQKHPDRHSGDTRDFIALKEAFVFLTKEIESQPTPKHTATTTEIQATVQKNENSKTAFISEEVHNKLTLYEESFSLQSETIRSLRKTLSQTINSFDQKKNEIQEEFEKEVNTLEKQYEKRGLYKLFFFLPRMKEQEFWQKYRQKVDQFSYRYNTVDQEFFKRVVGLYGNGLNELNKQIETAHEELDKNES